MLRPTALFFLLLFFLRAAGQVPVNNPIDPHDTELVEAVRFISNYYAEFGPKKKFPPDFSKYWTEDDCNFFQYPDQMLFAIHTSIPTYLLGKPIILSVKPEHGYIHIKTMFSRQDSMGNPLVTAITNHYIERTDRNKLVFINPMKIADKNWIITTVRNLVYCYPAYHHFDKGKAKSLIRQIMALEKEWELPPIGIRYFFADTKEEIEHYRGFDYTIAMGNRDKPTGMSDGIDNIIYCGGWGENYFHEVVHLYLNRLFPQSPLIEGLAVFYGGSLGHELGWHLQRINEYLLQHPEISLEKPEEFYYMDNFTNPYSAIQGMFCQAAYNKEGINGLRRVMNYTSLNELFEREYNIKKGDRNAFLRAMIGEKRNKS